MSQSSPGELPAAVSGLVGVFASRLSHTKAVRTIGPRLLPSARYLLQQLQIWNAWAVSTSVSWCNLWNCCSECKPRWEESTCGSAVVTVHRDYSWNSCEAFSHWHAVSGSVYVYSQPALGQQEFWRQISTITYYCDPVSMTPWVLTESLVIIRWTWWVQNIMSHYRALLVINYKSWLKRLLTNG